MLFTKSVNVWCSDDGLTCKINPGLLTFHLIFVQGLVLRSTQILTTVPLLKVQDATHPQANHSSSQKLYMSPHMGSKYSVHNKPVEKGHKTQMALQPHPVLHGDKVRDAFHFSIRDWKINQNTETYKNPVLLITLWWIAVKRPSHPLA